MGSTAISDTPSSMTSESDSTPGSRLQSQARLAISSLQQTLSSLKCKLSSEKDKKKQSALRRLLLTAHQRFRDSNIEQVLSIASPKQLRVADAFFSGRYDVVAAMGGNQSGKSFIASRIFAKYLRDDAGPNTKFWCVAPNSEKSVTKQQEELWNCLPRNLLGRYQWDDKNGFGSKVPMFVLDERTDENPNGRHITVRFKSQSQYEADKDSFESETLDGCWIDESISLPCYNALQPRLALKDGFILISSIPAADWMYEVIEEAPEETSVFLEKLLPMDNPVMTQARYDRLAASITSEEERKMRLHGEFMFFGGIVYKEFRKEYHPDGHLARSCDLPKDVRWYAGLDIGMDHPTVWLLVAVDKTNRAWVVDEYVRRHSLISDDVLAIKAIIGKRHLEWPTVCDPAAWQISKANQFSPAEQYQALGLPIIPGLRTAKYGELAQVQEIIERIRGKELLVCDNCNHLIREFRTWKYKRDTHGEPLGREAFEDKNNDGLDALRYLLSMEPTYRRQESRVIFQD